MYQDVMMLDDNVPEPDDPWAAAVPRPPLRPGRDRSWSSVSKPSPRARLALGVALLVVLAAAWALVGRGAPHAPGPTRAAPPRLTRPSVTGSPVTGSSVSAEIAVPRWVPAVVAATCWAHRTSPAVSVVDCTPGRGVVSLRYRAFASVPALRAAYAAEGERAGGAGPSACAQGAPEERSWSVATAPARPAGRYRCSRVVGEARLVWTSEATRVLGVATRADGDLRSLYQWWTTVPGPTTPG
jgi:hypothetical protein